MGTCFSKKSVCATSSPVALSNPLDKSKSEETQPEINKGEEQSVVKKEVFIIKHRTRHEIERQRSDDEKGEAKKTEEFARDCELGSTSTAAFSGGAAVRTSSCTKEEVDAILIQCGRLSRSNSAGKAALSSENGGRKYSGSKRSYDFDNETGKSDGNNGDDERENRRRQSPGRRRTPSRERDQPRSGSRERSGGRRVSRSPGRRSESPITNRATADPSSNAANSRPGKMVSVPATVSSLAMDKNDQPNASSIKRIQVKRNAASPRARSPARSRNPSENQQQQQQPITLSRSNSRKAENSSPYRRNPLSEIDTNIILQKPNVAANGNKSDKKSLTADEGAAGKGPFVIGGNVAMNVIPSGQENNPKTQTVTRSRSSRLSRDLDIINPADTNTSSSSSSYTALLLEDIQNFHQKKNNIITPPPASSTAITLPPCVTKAHSILEAVADLNSTTYGSNLNKISDNRPTKHLPVMESEVVGKDDDLMEPSFHKYVTVRRGTEDLVEEQQESSGSNSLQQQWLSSSCWEPCSGESAELWSSSSSSKLTVVSKHSESAGDGGKKVTAKKRVSDHHQNGIGRGRIGGTRGPHMVAPVGATAST